MVTYFTGKTFKQVIHATIEECDELIYNPVIDDYQDYYKYVKQNISSMNQIDSIIFDLSANTNTADETKAAFEMLRTMYDEIKIIVFAPYTETGDKLLTECLNMGITNIINTSDFKEIQTELRHCIREGKTYREAVKYKEQKMEKVSIKHAVKRNVDKHMIGIAGSEGNIGVTHNAIILANFFRKNGFMVAIAEMNRSGAFEAIRDSFDENMFTDGYFTMNGIDFYPSVDDERMEVIQSHSYNVIILDIGQYQENTKGMFERCEDRIIISGSRPWEMDAMNDVFSLASRDVLQKYIFAFNFTPEKDYEGIKSGMQELKNVYFLSTINDPFSSSDFSGAEEIFSYILPEEPVEEKKGIFDFLKKKKKEGTDERVSQ